MASYFSKMYDMSTGVESCSFPTLVPSMLWPPKVETLADYLDAKKSNTNVVGLLIKENKKMVSN